MGREAIEQNSVDLLVTLTDAIRFGGRRLVLRGRPPRSCGRQHPLRSRDLALGHPPPRWSGIPLALGFALFLPQFFTPPPPARIAHGLLVMIGCWLVAWSMVNAKTGEREDRAGSDGSR
ncbi:hypothetical protein [Methanoculleus chikugoensis]|uniref:hypothetical protein n=1 Tax=Methanoculleus chikugoensis TaxID=118126 RepID=UPI0006D070CA|nr:hypothetical protein [Methanoculleus chikugoensis]